MGKIKILQFPIANSNGGLTRYAINNWKHMDKTKFNCDFGTLSKKIDFENEILESGATVKYISCYAEENREQFIKEVKQILSKGYDIVHLHTSYWKSFLVEELAMECKIPKIIVHAHSVGIELSDEKQREEAEKIHNECRLKINTSLATDFWACSKKASDWLYGPQILNQSRRIIKNAIDAEKFRFNEQIRTKYREELGFNGYFVIGHVGRFAQVKNHEFLINIFAESVKENDKLRLILIGSGPKEKESRKLIERLGIEDKVVLSGEREDVSGLLQAMDMFCLPSLFEGFPLVLIEAQAAGLKCLVSDAITDEIRITNNVESLPLIKHLWVKRILEEDRNYARKDMYYEITDAGYNIREQIREIEKFYKEI